MKKKTANIASCFTNFISGNEWYRLQGTEVLIKFSPETWLDVSPSITVYNMSSCLKLGVYRGRISFHFSNPAAI